MKYFALIFIVFVSYLLLSPAKSQTHKHALIPQNYLIVPVGGSNANQVTEVEFHKVIDTIFQIFSPEISSLGGVLEIQRDWGDWSVNAFAWREGPYYMLEILGGMARHKSMDLESFTLVICHELGHLLGGSPKRYDISAEGQSDYFASWKCLKRVLDTSIFTRPSQTTDYERKICAPLFAQSKRKQHNCEHTLEAGYKLSRLFALISQGPLPEWNTPDTTLISKTRYDHPEPQCRLDTFKAGALCSTEPSNSLHGCPSIDRSAKRPGCWFKD